MADEALSLDVTAIAAVGTEGLRTAGNSDAVVAAFALFLYALSRANFG